jgi:hypothetical protein
MSRSYVRSFPTEVSLMSPTYDCRAAFTSWLHWGNVHSAQIPYTESAARAAFLSESPGHLPLETDCSGWSVAVAKWCGMDVSKLHGTDWVAFTGTFLAAGEIIPASEAGPGDFVVYGPGTGIHMAPILEGGPDPLTASHGSAGVDLIRVSHGNPSPGSQVRFVRIGTSSATPPVYAPGFAPPVPAKPPAPKPQPKPKPSPKPPAPLKSLTADQVAARDGLVQIDHKEALMCVDHHLAWYTFDHGAMHGHSDRNLPATGQLYAYKNVLDGAGIPHAGA